MGPINQNAMTRGLLDWFGDDRPVVDRATLLPIGQYEDGGLTFAWPGFLKDAWEGAQRTLLDAGNVPVPDAAPGTRWSSNVDAFNVVSVAPVGTVGARAVGLTNDVGDLGMFAGKMAKTADHAKLAQAERMTGEGAPREQIWNDTGWFQGVDGKWRFEIDDSGMKTGLGEGVGFAGGPIDHPLMALAYPDANVLVRSQRTFPGFAGGAFYDGRGLRAPSMDVAAATHGGRQKLAAHETQHFVQDAEGFAPGSSDMFPNYERYAGEVEARAVERRLGLTAEQRAARPPWLDYDVPEADQIFQRYGLLGP
jgi:hypothetical protein